jgi:hypothetical protein
MGRKRSEIVLSPVGYSDDWVGGYLVSEMQFYFTE